MYLKVTHGTVTEVPAWEGHVDDCMMFDNLSFDHDDAKTKAVYFTDEKDICKFFSDEKNHDPSAMIQTVITGNVASEKAYIIDKTPTDCHSYDGVEYLWPEDRDSLYDRLREDGFDAMVINSGYKNAKGEDCADIAVLDPSIISYVSASLKINGKWTPEMGKEDLRNTLINISNNPDLLLGNNEVSDRDINQDDFYLSY